MVYLYLILLVISLCVYIACRQFLTYFKIGKRSYRKYIAVVSALVFSPMIFGVMMLFAICGDNYIEEDFDKSLWHEQVEERYKMSKNIIDSKMLIGKTRPEVIAILGTDFYSSKEGYLFYYLGFVPRFNSIDPDILEVFFEDERVVEVRQRET